MVSFSGRAHLKYSYDALGRRSQKKIIENNTEKIRKYIYDGNEILAELNVDNSVLVRYSHSGLRTDDTLAMDVTSAGVNEGIAPSSGTYHFLKDGLGSVIDIADSNGTIVQHYVYGSFGKILKITNGGVDSTLNPLIKNSFTYTNREYDSESGLYYYRARYYDGHSGRFLQEDPLPGVMGVPSTINSSYSYVLNNPIRYTDPEGKILPALAIAFIIGGALNAALAKNGSPWYTNFLVGGGLAVAGTIVGAAGAAAGAGIATYFGGSAVLGGAIGGGVFSGGLSYGLQRIMNPDGPVNWLSVGFATFAGALGGAMAYSGVGQSAQNIDAFNKTVGGSLIDSIGNSATPAANPVSPVLNPTPPPPPMYIPSPM